MRLVRLLVCATAVVVLGGCESARLRRQADAGSELDAAGPRDAAHAVDADAELPVDADGMDADATAPLPDAGPDAALDPDMAIPDTGPSDAGSGCNPADTVVPETPLLLAPWNGATWGSALAPDTLRPRLRWREARRACTYEVQLDRTCDPLTFATCDHGGDVPATSTDALELTPADPLPVRTMAPVGDRYYWRARACNAVGCSDWSPTRYLDVGRLPDDFDGDGDSEAVIGCPECRTMDDHVGAVFVYDGGSTLDEDPLRIDHPNADYARFGAALSTGDIDGDGFGDLVVGAWSESGPVEGTGGAYVMRGSPSGLRVGTADIVHLVSDRVTANGHFGSTVAVAGDVDADGDRDVVIGAPEENGSRGGAHLSRGTPAGIDPSASATLATGPLPGLGHVGGSVARAGDLDGDGIVEIVVGDPSHTTADARGEAGMLLIWRGAATGDHGRAETFTRAEPSAGDLYGVSVAGGFDLDDDGLSDLVIGADARGVGIGSIHVAYGSREELLVPGPVCSDLALVRGAMLGWNVIAPGDVDGDGITDLFATAPALYALGTPGRLYRISPIGSRDRLLCDLAASDPHGGSVVYGYGLGGGDFDGDGDADVLVGAGAPIGDGRLLVSERGWILRGGATTLAPPMEILPPFAALGTAPVYGFGRLAD